MNLKIHLIKHDINSIGYQAFKEEDGELVFYKDLNFLTPDEYYVLTPDKYYDDKYYDGEEEETFYDFRLPLIRALKDIKIGYKEDCETFIISEHDFETLSEHLFETKIQNLQKTVDENRKKSIYLLKEAELAEAEIKKMVELKQFSTTKPKMRP